HLCAAVDDGRLESDAVWAVLSAVDVAPVSQAAPNGLTARELEVLRHAAKGMSNREIAVALVISERTVGHHLAHVFDKTGYRTRAGVAVWAVQRGLIPAEPGDLERALS
ncbi:MAG TPA: LuxR C-terminal-related transcriptional regulator, partial [Gordonia sp. (in: high G+C Gram-positive bacteria)]|nr:LuxR C-terminal-related transcriptional regulator [Gordonia sp. (in: high G+C Gram-positive bacteria)]